MKFVKYFLQKKSVTILLLLLVLGGGLLSYVKMGKLEDAPFTIKQDFQWRETAYSASL